jgi:hypothetical protein
MAPDTLLRPLRIPVILFISLLALLGSSCGQETERTAVLLTDRPEFTAYAEQFNTAQNQYRLIVEFSDTPRESLDSRHNAPDLIIDSHLNSVRYLSQFATLEKLFMEQELSKERFYQEPLIQGTYEEQQVILPVSFSLPAVIQKKGLELQDAPAFFYSIEDIKALCRQFNRIDDEEFAAMGYAPSWSSGMLYIVTVLRGAHFRESSNSSLLWNGEKLRSAVAEIENWPSEVNESEELQKQFTDKFLYEPPLKLIRQERILFHYTDTSSFYEMSPEQREDLETHWLASDGQVPVLSDMLFAGIPHGAEGIEAARAFLKWFFDSGNQERLIRNSMYKQMRHFGIAGGFSSLPQVNEEVLPRYYPSLVGYTPRESFLAFPPPLPPEWPAIKREILEPWLMQRAKNGADVPSLQERINTWMRQRPADSR